MTSGEQQNEELLASQGSARLSLVDLPESTSEVYFCVLSDEEIALALEHPLPLGEIIKLDFYPNDQSIKESVLRSCQFEINHDPLADKNQIARLERFIQPGRQPHRRHFSGAIMNSTAKRKAELAMTRERSNKDQVILFSAEVEERIVNHMNEDHVDAMEDYCRARDIRLDHRQPKMVGVDSLGFNLLVGSDFARFSFDNYCSSAHDVRVALVNLAKASRSNL